MADNPTDEPIDEPTGDSADAAKHNSRGGPVNGSPGSPISEPLYSPTLHGVMRRFYRADSASYWRASTKEQDRMWTTVMLDFFPLFLGATMMGLASRIHSERGSNPSERWTAYGRELHAVGIAPQDYYVIMLTLPWRDRKERAEKHEHAFITWVGRSGRPGLKLVPSVWAWWPKLLDEGLTPMQATRVVLEGQATARRDVAAV